MVYSVMDAIRVDTLKRKEDLNKLIKGRNTPQKVVLRAKIAMKIEEGMPKKRIAEGLNISRSTVYLWASRYEKGGVAALLKDAPRPGRIPLTTLGACRRNPLELNLASTLKYAISIIWRVIYVLHVQIIRSGPTFSSPSVSS
jgi:hypothetical protein